MTEMITPSNVATLKLEQKPEMQTPVNHKVSLEMLMDTKVIEKLDETVAELRTISCILLYMFVFMIVVFLSTK